MDACLFCRIVAKEIPAQVVHEDADTLAFRDIAPVAPFHVLVIPKRHVETLADADAATAGKLATLAARLAAEAGHREGGSRVVTNSGPDAGQSVRHLHFHALAGRKLAWPPG